MRLASLPAFLALGALLTLGLVSDEAKAAPANLPDRPLDLELKEADIKNVFALLAEVSGRKVVLDPCVHGTVDVRLKNTPLPLVYDALAMKLHLVYADDASGTINVGCAAAVAQPKAAEPRISIAVSAALLDDVLRQLATAAKLDGVDYRAAAHPKVSVTLEGVRPTTAFAVLAESTGLKIAVAGDKVVVSE